MSNNKQSSVEWLLDNLHLQHSTKWPEIVERAKAMHKEEIDESYEKGYQNGHEAAMSYINTKEK